VVERDAGTDRRVRPARRLGLVVVQHAGRDLAGLAQRARDCRDRARPAVRLPGVEARPGGCPLAEPR
jgi:hypothetical protein